MEVETFARPCTILVRGEGEHGRVDFQFKPSIAVTIRCENVPVCQERSPGQHALNFFIELKPGEMPIKRRYSKISQSLRAFAT